MLRAFSNSLLSLLMIATLLWGGCISCPQFFMFSPQAEKSCCKKNGQCERPTKNAPTAPAKECKRMPVEPQGSDSVHGASALAADLTGPIVVLPLQVASIGTNQEAPDAGHSPPDLNVLHSTFLI